MITRERDPWGSGHPHPKGGDSDFIGEPNDTSLDLIRELRKSKARLGAALRRAWVWIETGEEIDLTTDNPGKNFEDLVGQIGDALDKAGELECQLEGSAQEEESKNDKQG